MGGEPASGFGDRLRQFRKKALLTKEELAARAAWVYGQFRTWNGELTRLPVPLLSAS
jgi:hypothetical protein